MIKSEERREEGGEKKKKEELKHRQLRVIYLSLDSSGFLNKIKGSSFLKTVDIYRKIFDNKNKGMRDESSKILNFSFYENSFIK